LRAFFNGYCALTSAGRAKNACEAAKAASTSVGEMPWSTTWKKPMSVAAAHSWAVISARRAPKSAREICRTSRSVVSVPGAPMRASRSSSVRVVVMVSPGREGRTAAAAALT
jgi:hypothetical protein